MWNGVSRTPEMGVEVGYVGRSLEPQWLDEAQDSKLL